MSEHLEKLKDLKKRFNDQYDDMTDDQKKGFTNSILNGAIKREEATVLAYKLLKEIEGRKEQTNEQTNDLHKRKS